MAKHNITYKQIFDLYQNKGSEGIYAMFTDKNNNKIKITKDQKVVSRLVEFLKTEKTNNFWKIVAYFYLFIFKYFV